MSVMKRTGKGREPVYRTEDHTTIFREKDGVVWLTYELFDQAGLFHGLSTRIGGVSKGHFAEMNLSYSRGDETETVDENHRRFASALGYPSERLVMTDQVHGIRIRRVEAGDAGKGVAEKGTDGLVTNVPGIPLMIFYADCVPLIFYDPVRKVCGAAHSGWRGTVQRIGAEMVRRMKEEYGTRPEDIYAAIGPSVCQKCYEVDAQVLREFNRVFGDRADRWFARGRDREHFQLDLASACAYTLMEAGVPKKQVAMPDLCTCCNPRLLFSHRASGDKRGNLGAVVMIRTC